MYITDPLIAVALGAEIVSALMILWFLIFRQHLTTATEVVLLFGIDVFPITTAMTGNYSGFEATTKHEFCGSCHVMKPYKLDSEDIRSTSLAARHARND